MMHHRPVLHLGPRLMPDFAIGAMFNAILAWPTAEEMASFHRASEVLMAGSIQMIKAENPDIMQSIFDQWPQFNWAAIEAKSSGRRSPRPGYFDKRLKQRMAAARIGIGKTHRELFGIPAIMPPGMTALSIDQLCELVKSDVSIDDPGNIEARVWRKSLPILHLAIASQLFLAGRFNDRTKDGVRLDDLEFYREAVRIAGMLEMMLHDHPDIPITHSEMTLLRWVE